MNLPLNVNPSSGDRTGQRIKSLTDLIDWAVRPAPGVIAIAWIDLKSIRTIGILDDPENQKRSYGNHSQTIGAIRTIQIYPRNHHFPQNSLQFFPLRFVLSWRPQVLNFKPRLHEQFLCGNCMWQFLFVFVAIFIFPCRWWEMTNFNMTTAFAENLAC